MYRYIAEKIKAGYTCFCYLTSSISSQTSSWEPWKKNNNSCFHYYVSLFCSTSWPLRSGRINAKLLFIAKMQWRCVTVFPGYSKSQTPCRKNTPAAGWWEEASRSLEYPKHLWSYCGSNSGNSFGLTTRTLIIFFKEVLTQRENRIQLHIRKKFS